MAQTTMKREHALHDRRRGQNLGVLVVLLATVVMLFAITIVKLPGAGATVGNPTASQAGGWDLGGALVDMVQEEGEGPAVHVATEPDRGLPAAAEGDTAAPDPTPAPASTATE
ncbi:MAG: hypothetical protein AAF677_02340 [Pseudomonadota bacterium]